MALLTTSQLTFYDLKDAYHVEINPDCIVINCDEKGISKEETIVDISYGIYCGSTRVPGTAKVINFEINGSQIPWTATECSGIDDGHVEFTIPANIKLSDIDSVNIQFIEKNSGDTEEFTFDKYIQLIKVNDGASGTGMVFKIYSEDGTAFREDMSAIKLETVVFIGESSVDPSGIESYKWEWRDSNNEWHNIKNEENPNTLTVNKDDEWAFKTIRCTIHYNSNNYEDYISLTDDVVIYSSEIRYFNGSNILSNSYNNKYSNGSNVFGYADKYIVAYMALYKNGEEIDRLPASQYCIAESIDEYDVISANPEKEDGSNYGSNDVGKLLYFIVPGSTNANIYSLVLGQFDGTVWNVVKNHASVIDPSYECVYENSKSYNNLTRSTYDESNKIMIISKEQIDKTLTIGFNAYKKTNIDSPVSAVIGNVIDTNDPYISPDPPENPVDGTLWMNINTTPYVLQVCHINDNGEATWVNVNQQSGAVYTSMPYSYLIGDVWVLNENEYCTYTDEDGVTYSYGPGSMLKSSAFRTEDEIKQMDDYPFSDWSDAQPTLTEMKDNVKNYFEFNADDGLKIGRRDEKFYVQITSEEMGFFERDDDGGDPEKVVSIGRKTATIKNANIKDSATFECNTDFKKQINMYNAYSTKNAGFAWKIETNGSLSLVVIS